jgi:hypothetical protein
MKTFFYLAVAVGHVSALLTSARLQSALIAMIAATAKSIRKSVLPKWGKV